MLPAVVIWSVFSGVVALCAAIAMDLSFWMVLLGYSVGGTVGLLGIAVVANVMSGRAGIRAGFVAVDHSMDGLQNR